MPERIHIDPGALARAAGQHAQTSDHLAAVPAAHPQIEASLRSLGPVYGDLLAAAGPLLEARRRCYQEQAAAHSELADNLYLTVATWDDHEQDVTAAHRRLTGGV
ncbi:ESX-1 secretion-associated protein [Mycobacterium sp. M1]|uniref:ESX-1 secretion-associated protein n=1 Tax=Mycolicibacter acidiphilus TaxID=2835306 RepID=A0ABS5RJI2_9MYCO|nr:type VII secretion target [Mycolicibacter acidiphilus]MBS9533738.1 ESX-1 secretion-associated protein [Mycolicibacter acidiphilus]